MGAESDYVSFEEYRSYVAKKFNDWLQSYPNTCPLDGVSSTVLLEGLGFTGKTSFIRHDLKSVVETCKATTTYGDPVFVHCDYDAFDHYPSKIEVILYIRNKLVAAGVNLPRLDVCLREYARRVDVGVQGRLDESGVRDDSSKIMKLCEKAGDFIIELLLENDLPMIGSILLQGVVEGADSVARPADEVIKWLNTHSLRELLDVFPDAQLSYLLELSLLADIDIQNKIEGWINQGKRPICVALDGIGGVHGAEEGCWERIFSRSGVVFSILSARSIDKGFNGNRIDFDNSIGVVEAYLEKHKANFDSQLNEFLKAHPAIGLARLVHSIVEMGSRPATDELRGMACRLVGDDSKYINVVRAVLDIQLRYLPNDQIQALCILAWFDVVDVKWLVRELAMVRPLSRAFYLDGGLPYVVIEGTRWRLHSLICTFVRLDCDPFTIESVYNTLNCLVPESASRFEEGECALCRSALARLRVRQFVDVYRSCISDDRPVDLMECDPSRETLERCYGMFVCALRKNSQERESLVRAYFAVLNEICNWNESCRNENVERCYEIAVAVAEGAESIISLLFDDGDSAISQVPGDLAQGVAHLLTRAGAVYSDMYRHDSNIAHHRDGFKLERKALRLIMQHAKDSLDSRELAGALNSVAVSAYRLRGYRQALEFHARSLCVLKKDAKHCSSESVQLRAQLLRAWSASLYACAVDMNGGQGDFPDNLEDLCLLEQAIALGKQAAEISPVGSWPALMTVASCQIKNGEYKLALQQLDELFAQIEAAGKGTSLYAARCLTIRARCEVDMVNDRESQNEAEGLLKRALEDARKAFKLNAVEGCRRLDARKGFELIENVERLFAEFCFDVPPIEDAEYYELAGRVKLVRNSLDEARDNDKDDLRRLGEEERGELDYLLNTFNETFLSADGDGKGVYKKVFEDETRRYE